MKRKSKCYATPKWYKFCDGCKTNSTKCPLRNKTKDLRAKIKIEAENEIKNQRSEINRNEVM